MSENLFAIPGANEFVGGINVNPSNVIINNDVAEYEEFDGSYINERNLARAKTRRKNAIYTVCVEGVFAYEDGIPNWEPCKVIKLASSVFARQATKIACRLGIKYPVIQMCAKTVIAHGANGDLETEKSNFGMLEAVMTSGMEVEVDGQKNYYEFFCSTPSGQKKLVSVWCARIVLDAWFENYASIMKTAGLQPVARAKYLKMLATTLSTSEETGIPITAHICGSPKMTLDYAHYSINKNNERKMCKKGEDPFEHKEGDGQSIIVVRKDERLYNELKKYFGYIPSFIQLRDENNNGIKTIALVVDGTVIDEFINDAAKAIGVEKPEYFGCGFDPRQEGMITTGDALKIPGDNRSSIDLIIASCKAGNGKPVFGNKVPSQIVSWLFGMIEDEKARDAVLRPLVEELKKPFKGIEHYASFYVGKNVRLCDYNGRKIFRISGMSCEETVRWAATCGDPIVASVVMYPSLIYSDHVQDEVRTKWASCYMEALTGRIPVERCGYFHLFEDQMHWLAKCIRSINGVNIDAEAEWLETWRIQDIYAPAFNVGVKCASWRNPFTSAHGLVTFNNKAGAKFIKNFATYGDCVFARAGHKAYRRWMADNDGDEVAISNFRPLVECFERSMDIVFNHNIPNMTGRVTVVFNDIDSTEKVEVNPHNMCEDMKNTHLSDNIGKIATLISNLTGTTPENINLRQIEQLEMLENYSIDASKRGIIVLLTATIMRLMRATRQTCWRSLRDGIKALLYTLLGNENDYANTGVINAIGSYLKETVGAFATDFPKMTRRIEATGMFKGRHDYEKVAHKFIMTTSRVANYADFCDVTIEIDDNDIGRLNGLLFGHDQGKEDGKELRSVVIGKQFCWIDNRPCEMTRDDVGQILAQMQYDDNFIALYDHFHGDVGMKEQDACLRAIMDYTIGEGKAQEIMAFKAFSDKHAAYRNISFERLMKLYGKEVVQRLVAMHGGVYTIDAICDTEEPENIDNDEGGVEE